MTTTSSDPNNPLYCNFSDTFLLRIFADRGEVVGLAVEKMLDANAVFAIMSCPFHVIHEKSWIIATYVKPNFNWLTKNLSLRIYEEALGSEETALAVAKKIADELKFYSTVDTKAKIAEDSEYIDLLAKNVFRLIGYNKECVSTEKSQPTQ